MYLKICLEKPSVYFGALYVLCLIVLWDVQETMLYPSSSNKEHFE